jgi:hypothetical protein
MELQYHAQQAFEGGWMVHGHSLDEQRQYQRFQVTAPAFVNDSVKIGKIVDISMSGLAFTYEGLELWPQHAAALDLLIDKEIFLKEVPVRVVSDEVIARGSRHRLVTRQCGVQFGRLTSYQVHQLENFIQVHIQEAQIAAAREGLSENQGYD